MSAVRHNASAPFIYFIYFVSFVSFVSNFVLSIWQPPLAGPEPDGEPKLPRLKNLPATILSNVDSPYAYMF